ncbi:MFS transporter [Acidisoma silvae]|uniref:MFS transporter n=1 Tax=Acidisoma silvae TaxID=2802396 RepID=A0A963YTC3_9PROT|nr:MFS transporter [Acidisoma silvae]MCB8876162.1 MFS transporter [Acidisoma silvae]
MITQAGVTKGIGPRYMAARCFVILAVAIAMVGSSAPSPIYGVYAQHMHLNHMMLTVIYGFYSLGTVAALFLLGRISDRIPDRRVLLIVALCCAILGGILMALAGNVPVMLIGRFFAGMGTGCIIGPATAALVELDPARDRVRAAIVATVAVTAGITSGVVITAAALEERFAPTLTSFVVIIVVASITIAALLLVRWVPHDVAPATVHPTAQAKSSMGAMIREAGAGFWISCAGMVTAWMVGGCFLALGAIFARQLAGIHDPAIAALTVAVFQVVAGCVQLGGRNQPPRRLLMAGAVFMMTGLVLATLAAAIDSAVLFCIGALFTGMGYGGGFSASAAIGNRSAPARARAAIVSLTYIAGYLGNLIPVILLGVIADLFGLFAAITVLAAGAVLLGGSLILAVRRLPAET